MPTALVGEATTGGGGDLTELALLRLDLVMTENGCRVSASTWNTERQLRGRRLAGWQASVTEPMLKSPGFL